MARNEPDAMVHVFNRLGGGLILTCVVLAGTAIRRLASLSIVAVPGDVVKYYAEHVRDWAGWCSHRELGVANPRTFGSGFQIPNSWSAG